MYTSDGDDVLEFKVNYAVTRKIKKGFFNLSSKEEETVILNNGKKRFSITYLDLY